MLQTFVITLREGVEAALVIAIAVAYLRKTGRVELLPAVYRALITAVIACFVAAWGFTKIDLSADSYEGYTLLLSAVFVFSMVVWMNRHGRKLKGEIESRLQEGAHGGRGSWGVFLFVFLMIFREGVETVLLLCGRPAGHLGHSAVGRRGGWASAWPSCSASASSAAPFASICGSFSR